MVHIGQCSNDLHATAMGLRLATILVDAGAVVTVFLDREGVRLIDEDQPVLVYGDADTGQLLRDGVEMGTKEAIAELFLNADKEIDF